MNVEVCMNARKGRYLQALRDINGGEIILYGVPYTTSTDPSCNVCCTCWKEITDISWRCLCGEFVWCSEDCRERGKNIHQQDSLHCVAMSLLYTYTKDYVLDQIIDLKALLSMLCNGLREDEIKGWFDLETVNNTLNTAEFSPTMSHIRNLEGHNNCYGKEHTKGIQIISKDAVDIIRKAVGLYKTNYKWKEPRHYNELICKDFAMDLLYKFKCNNFGVWNEEGKCVGSCLYGAISFINHSCFPNACRVSSALNPSLITIRALYPIPKGSEIVISYIDVNLSFLKRQEMLTFGYSFTCICERCEIASRRSQSPHEAYVEEILCPNECGGLLCPVLLETIPREHQKQQIEIDNFCEPSQCCSKPEAKYPHFQYQSLITRKCNICSCYDPLGISLYEDFHHHFLQFSNITS